ncbi:MAG: type II toxin-antitoxin system PemK/MazF family toxin [Candidatus Nanopelagicales bacterium]
MRPTDEPDPRPDSGGAYSYSGRVTPDYAPEHDGDPDPGEIVWAWVPYEEDDRVGKDRPLVAIGRGEQPRQCVAFMLSSRDHAGDRGWVSVGSGDWDRERRESWVRVDRPLGIDDGAVRREGAVLPRDRFLELLIKARQERNGIEVD